MHQQEDGGEESAQGMSAVCAGPGGGSSARYLEGLGCVRSCSVIPDPPLLGRICEAMYVLL